MGAGVGLRGCAAAVRWATREPSKRPAPGTPQRLERRGRGADGPSLPGALGKSVAGEFVRRLPAVASEGFACAGRPTSPRAAESFDRFVERRLCP